MALVVPNASEVYMLEYILNQQSPTDLTIRLYANDVTPAEATIITDLTEVVGGGYAAVALTSGTWVITPGDPSEAAYTQITWTFTGSVGNVYGYYVTRANGDLMWAERFSNGPYNISTSGDEIRVTQRLTLE